MAIDSHQDWVSDRCGPGWKYTTNECNMYGIDNIISVTTLTLTYWKSDNLFVVMSIVWAVGQIAKLKLCC